ncbi:CRISPR-associated ring nuclease Csm6 [Methyloversatilis sp.]|uniref:CRISPR-associated ring nuclease Csm6 n=1 Tax=Methyloversatilis sp. TaxID=2569862 RepID=UPI0035B4F99B
MIADPARYPRRILLAVTGLSPQVLTETLYALTAAPSAPGFMPTEIHLLTTTMGKDLARTALLHPDGGHFHALLADYPQIGQPAFDENRIHVIRKADGTPLPDIRTPEENACAADAITALVAELTRDEDAALHVSIAGGRKTMGFYLGYAFSLYARPQDRLSHVLVSSPFENHPEFFFPPATPRRLTTRDNTHLDTATAAVTLAEIPVVRLRHGLPARLLHGQAGFNDTVIAVQESLAPPRLDIDLSARRVMCGNRAVQLPPARLAWLAWWATLARAGRPMLHWRDADAKSYLEIYARVVGRDADALEQTAKRLHEGMEKDFFEQNNAKLERALHDQLGPAAKPYLLDRSGKRPHTRRGLSLPATAITIS